MKNDRTEEALYFVIDMIGISLFLSFILSYFEDTHSAISHGLSGLIVALIVKIIIEIFLLIRERFKNEI